MTKVAISTTGKDLNSSVDPRFGRANAFLIVNLDNNEFDYIDNSKISSIGQGAGIQTAEMISKTDVKTVLTGSVGPKAAKALSLANIKFIEGFDGMNVIDALSKYKEDNK